MNIEATEQSNSLFKSFYAQDDKNSPSRSYMEDGNLWLFGLSCKRLYVQ